MKEMEKKASATGRETRGKSALHRLLVANVLAFLCLLITLTLVLWILGLWNSILTFLF